MSFDRRGFVAASLGVLILPGAARGARPGALHDIVAACEAESGGRMGVAVLDTATGARFGYRGGERFAMCSTFKALLAAAVLARVDRRQDVRARAVPVRAADLLDASPFSTTRVGGTATVAELCEAMVTRSDNAAANLMLASIGGPAGLTRFLRATGDPVTRLDRTEPALNSAIRGDPRDTSTPFAMVATWQRLLLGTVLSAPSRALLTGWLVTNQTGGNRLRAGLPRDWRVGDKTGTSDAAGGDTVNDIAILWPPRRPPLLVACFLTEAKGARAASEALHARVAAGIARH